MKCLVLKQNYALDLYKLTKTAMQMVLNQGSLTADYNRSIKRAQLLFELKDVVVKISQHFKENNSLISSDPSVSDTTKRTLVVSKEKVKFKRGKAIKNFDKRFAGELGFNINDIITIIDQEDEYCWIGKLNNAIGWFPAKFVEVLDERSKFYNKLGDDDISEKVNRLIRNDLFTVIVEILSHGLKNFLLSKSHPWYFIEEASFAKIEKDNFDVIYSRLVLCRVFNLEEENKFLSAEELLYRSVHTVNAFFHNKTKTLDSKLKSLMCRGLNEQVLHLWLDIWCSSDAIVRKWYYPWAVIINKECRKMIRYLMDLSYLPFHLNPNYDLNGCYQDDHNIRNDVRDILSRYYLFSWDV